jgi:uncharacterized membrane protein YgcG
MTPIVRRLAATAAAVGLALSVAAPAALGAITLPPKQSGVTVYDLANIWKPSTEQTAQSIIQAVQISAGAEVVAVSIENDSTSVTTDEAHADAQSILDTWSVGSAAIHDGVVVLFDMNHGSTTHGQMYVQTGSGFTESLTTGKSIKQIVDEDMLPVAKTGDLDSALLVGLADVATVAKPRSFPIQGPATHVLPPSQAGVNVYDLASIWNADTKSSAQTIADGIKARTQAEVAVVSWESDDYDVSTDTARADALTIMNTWGVGRAGVNDGLVVLFDMNHGSSAHGQIYLYAGSGFIASYLDPTEAAQIVDNDMLPAAKDGNLDKALLDGLHKVDHVTQPGGNPDRALRPIINALMVVAVIGVGGLVLAWFLWTWWARGRDARVVVIDDSVLLPSPPPGLTPALATVLQADAVNRESFTSALVDLGHRGLVTFQQASGVFGIGAHVDMVVPPEPLIDPNSLEARRRPLGAAEAALAMSIASKAVGGVLSWSQLKAGEGAKLYASFKKNIGQAAAQSGFFRDDPNSITGRWVGIGVAVIVAVVVFGYFFAFDLSDSGDLFKPGMAFLGLPMLVSGLMGLGVILFSGRLAARTESGAQALGMALAYRNTLRYEIQQAKTVDQAVAQTKTKLPWITTPDLLTVWAVAFGLKSDIDKLIKETMEVAASSGTTVWAPTWYAGSSGIGSIGGLASSIGSISTSATSSSGSGFGGGGGGGGGGAGGGF